MYDTPHEEQDHTNLTHDFNYVVIDNVPYLVNAPSI